MRLITGLLWVALVSCLAGTVAAQPGGRQGPPPRGLDEFAVAPHVQFTGVRQVTMRIAGQERTFREQVSVGNRRTRIQFLEGPLAGQYVIEDGRQRFHVVPGTRTVRVSPTRPEVPAMWIRGGQNNRIAAGSILGLEAQRMNFYQGPQNRLRLSIWQNPETRIILRREVYGPNGRVTARSEFLSLDLQAQLEPRLFEIPGDFQRINPMDELRTLSQEVGIPVHGLGPESGFEFAAVRVLSFGNQRGLIQTYNRYGDTLSFVVVRGTIDGARLRALAQNHESVLTWSDRGITFALIGEVPQEDLPPIRQAMRPR